MRCYENVAWNTLQKRIASLKIGYGVGILLARGEQEIVGRNRREAVGIDHVQALTFLAGTPGPARTSFRVAGCEMRRNPYRTSVQHFPILRCLDFSYSCD